MLIILLRNADGEYMKSDKVHVHLTLDSSLT